MVKVLLELKPLTYNVEKLFGIAKQYTIPRKAKQKAQATTTVVLAEDEETKTRKKQ